MCGAGGAPTFSRLRVWQACGIRYSEIRLKIGAPPTIEDFYKTQLFRISKAIDCQPFPLIPARERLDTHMSRLERKLDCSGLE